VFYYFPEYVILLLMIKTMFLQEYTEKIKSGQNLNITEAEHCLDLILSAATEDKVIASFLKALALKEESSEEIIGFARVMRERGNSIFPNHLKVVDTAGTGGGVPTFNISTAAAFVISGAGVPVAKHGNRAVTSKSGSADVLSALGVCIDRPPEIAEQCLNEFGIAFLFAPVFHPSMKRVAHIRRQLGQRTIFNLLGPLTNPAGAPYQIIGVYSPKVTEKMAQSLMDLGTKRAWVFHSQDGLGELSLGAPARVSEVKDSTLRTFDWDPRELGFSHVVATEYQGGLPEQNAGMIRSILKGQSKGPARDVVVLNAAAALHVADEGDFLETIRKAEESIDSGAALEKLLQLIQFYSD